MERRKRVSALRVLAIVALSIFVSEFLVMLLISFLPPLPIWAEALVDSHMLIVIVLPLLYIFLFRPFSKQIEDRVDAEFRLVNERDTVQRYLDVAGVMLLVIEKDESVRLINKRGIDILDYRESEVVGGNWFDEFVPVKSQVEVRDIFSILYSTRPEKAEYYENPVLTRGGEERMIAWHNTVLKDSHGKAIAVLCSGEDITERREAEDSLQEAHLELERRVKERTSELQHAKERLEKEFLEHKEADEALEETELRFKSVTESANEAIVAADSNAVIISWNKGAKNIFGYSAQEAIGKSLTVIIPKRYRQAHEEGFKRLIKTGNSSVLGKTLEFSGLRKNGSEFPLELSLATWKTGKGTFFSGIMRDITIRKRIEEEKENIQAQLLHSQKLEAIGRLIVGVAHDFSNIILSIKGYSSRTKKGLDEDGPLHENMEKVLLLVERGSKLTQQLLLFGRKEPLEFVEIDMNSTVDGLLSMTDNLLR
ncbi:MAG: PAS domain S-box protein, partial [Proteobacteria bacterium]|nr:PAS domain S-box protein [Pseudomonadota bacterium]